MGSDFGRFYDRQGNPMTMEEWGAKLDDDVYRRVGVWGDPDELWLSTVWLGIDHGWGDGPPIIFETMIFGFGQGNHCTRYATEAQALEGHRQAVEDIENNRMPWFVGGELEPAEGEP